MAEPRYLLIDRRFNRLCEFLHFKHGETADLFWIDVTDRPEITLVWQWHDDGTPEGKLSEPLPQPVAKPAEVVDYGAQPYRFDAGAGLPRHRHDFAHDHVVKKGRTIVTIEGQMEPTICIGPSQPLILPAGLFHGIIAIEDGTEFVNTRIDPPAT